MTEGNQELGDPQDKGQPSQILPLENGIDPQPKEDRGGRVQRGKGRRDRVEPHHQVSQDSRYSGYHQDGYQNVYPQYTQGGQEYQQFQQGGQVQSWNSSYPQQDRYPQGYSQHPQGYYAQPQGQFGYPQNFDPQNFVSQNSGGGFGIKNTQQPSDELGEIKKTLTGFMSGMSSFKEDLLKEVNTKLKEVSDMSDKNSVDIVASFTVSPVKKKHKGANGRETRTPLVVPQYEPVSEVEEIQDEEEQEETYGPTLHDSFSIASPHYNKEDECDEDDDEEDTPEEPKEKGLDWEGKIGLIKSSLGNEVIKTREVKRISSKGRQKEFISTSAATLELRSEKKMTTIDFPSDMTKFVHRYYGKIKGEEINGKEKKLLPQGVFPHPPTMSNKLYKLNSEHFGSEAPKVNPEFTQSTSKGHSRFSYPLLDEFKIKPKIFIELETALRQVTHALVVADYASAAVDVAVKEAFAEQGMPDSVREAMQLRATAVTANDQAIQTTIYNALKLYQLRRENVVEKLNAKISTSLRTQARQSGESNGFMLSQDLVNSCLQDLHEQDRLHALRESDTRPSTSKARKTTKKRSEPKQYDQYEETEEYYEGREQRSGSGPFPKGYRGKRPQKPKQQYSGADRGGYRGGKGGPSRGAPKGGQRKGGR